MRGAEEREVRGRRPFRRSTGEVFAARVVVVILNDRHGNSQFA
jgi:hypothetical protein